jgi:hypothetical protein
MPEIIYETDDAIFNFDMDSVIKHLKAATANNSLLNADSILDFINSQSGDSIEIPSDYDQFGYVILDLVDAGTGSAYCKICDKTYDANQLTPTVIGHGGTPFDAKIYIRELKRITGKPIKCVGMQGGKGFNCPDNHQLIAMITWMS